MKWGISASGRSHSASHLDPTHIEVWGRKKYVRASAHTGCSTALQDIAGMLMPLSGPDFLAMNCPGAGGHLEQHPKHQSRARSRQ